MLKPLDQADNQSAEFARRLLATRKHLRTTVINELPEAVLFAPLHYCAVRIAGMLALSERLAELDMSDEARVVRAEKYGYRADEINPSLKYQEDGAAFAHLYHSVERRAEIEAALKKGMEANNRPRILPPGFGSHKVTDEGLAAGIERIKKHYPGANPENRPRKDGRDGFGQPRRLGGDIISRGYFW